MGDNTLERGLHLSEGCLAEVGDRIFVCTIRPSMQELVKVKASCKEFGIEAMYCWLLVLAIRFGPQF